MRQRIERIIERVRTSPTKSPINDEAAIGDDPERGGKIAAEYDLAGVRLKGAMPLTHVNRPGVETVSGVHFPMMDGYKIVRVFVTVDALLGKDKSSAGVSYLDGFEANRDIFEYIAGEKYTLDQSIPKVTITFEDVLSAAQRKQTKVVTGSVTISVAPPPRRTQRDE